MPRNVFYDLQVIPTQEKRHMDFHNTILTFLDAERSQITIY
jgi:hypothetical protein